MLSCLSAKARFHINQIFSIDHWGNDERKTRRTSNLERFQIPPLTTSCGYFQLYTEFMLLINQKDSFESTWASFPTWTQYPTHLTIQELTADLCSHRCAPCHRNSSDTDWHWQIAVASPNHQYRRSACRDFLPVQSEKLAIKESCWIPITSFRLIINRSVAAQCFMQSFQATAGDMFITNICILLISSICDGMTWIICSIKPSKLPQKGHLVRVKLSQIQHTTLDFFLLINHTLKGMFKRYYRDQRVFGCRGDVTYVVGTIFWSHITYNFLFKNNPISYARHFFLFRYINPLIHLNIV